MIIIYDVDIFADNIEFSDFLSLFVSILHHR